MEVRCPNRNCAKGVWVIRARRTENKMIYPPTQTMVSIAFITLKFKSLKKLTGGANVESETRVDVDIGRLCVSKRLMIKAESKWINKRKYPRDVLDNIAVPTVPMIKSGPQLLQKHKVRSASLRDNLCSQYKFLTTFAPIGYPAKTPIKKAKKLSPGRCQRRWAKGVQCEINPCSPLSGTKILIKIIKGSIEGNTLLNHNKSPFCAA